ncbi:MAG TPA: PadR family transcriptional regulator [Candidatus Polarisedimenticolia bacterium]|jgi:transcriptional regulator|nr:PadR family transcriptional regulator [Candidatus Polarisedimenticolia bacterium]
MPEKAAGLIQGTLDMLILKTLALEPMHGFGIAQRIEQMSKGVFQVNAGSLFPAFRRLERGGLVDCEWRPTENNRRAKYYRLTDLGKKKLKVETRDWHAQVAAIARILEA